MRVDIDFYAENLMLTEEEMRAKKVEEQKIPRIIRLRDAYNYMLRNPLKKDREFIDYIEARSKDETGKPTITKRRAYEDLEILHAIVGSLQMCSKEWHRWRFNNMIMEGYAIALRLENPDAIARLAACYGKFNKLDREDEHDRGYYEIPHIRFTFDVSVMGFQPIPNVMAVIDKLTAEFSGTTLDRIAEDADAVELTEIPEEKGQKMIGNDSTGPISQ